MKQLTLFPPDNQVSIRMVPQPMPTWSFCDPKGWWEWPYWGGLKLVMADPEHSESLPRRGPYKERTFYGNRVIQKVTVRYTRSRGWLWVLQLREPQDDDYDAYWGVYRDLRRSPDDPRCEECGERDGVKKVSAMTAYHFEPGEEDPNRDLMLCDDCATDYRSYWTERWNDYYAGLL